MSPHAQRIARYALLAAVSTAGVFTIVASGGSGGQNPPAPPPTMGALSVNHGFGAVSSTPYQCTGSGTITATPQALTGTAGKTTTQTMAYTHSGNSSTTPNQPACQTSALFTGMATGTWQVSEGLTTCPATVIAGQAATVRIWNRACQ